MWSDEFDKKINEAADNHLPPFREEDWDRMNVLLDKHLPEEKKKRRFIPLLFLLLGGFSMLVILTTYKQAPVESAKRDNSNSISVTSSTKPEGITEDPVNASIYAEPGNHYPDQHLTDNKPTKEPSVLRTQRQDRPGTPVNIAKKRRKEIIPANIVTGEIKTDNTPVVPDKSETPSDVSVNNTSGNNLQVTGDTAKIIATATKTEDTTATAEITKTEKKSEKDKGSKWQLSFSAGPDLSVVGISKTGDWKMQYGIGVGYSISERVQLRTGFLISRKLYYADSSDYNPPKGFWAYYPNLQKIDANCLVYEIPLNVVYTFPSAKKHQWFVSGGLSSYLMKQETYEYYYKDPSGQDHYRERTINNENDHIISILHLSGGYQYKFNDKLSLMAEPYTKLPLGGVGFGKVKLNNTGVLFTVGYKPFAKKGK